MVFVCTTALTGALVLGSGIAGCRGNASSGGTGGSSSSSSSGTGGAMPVQVATIEQVTTGKIGPGTLVQMNNVVAMSRKFFVSKGHSGSCLWGVFVTAPGITETGPNTGMLALSYGTNATAMGSGTAYCPTIEANQPAGDAFPDDVVPGDELTIQGKVDAYIPSACASPDAGPGASNVPGIQVTSVTVATRTASGMPMPTPHVLNASDLGTLAGGSDKAWLDQWGNVRVEVQNVATMAYGGDGGTLEDKYGHMFLTDGVQIGDKLYYVGYVKGSDACHSGPVYPTNDPTFTSITGFVYLDYCNWSLAPSSKCFDLAPPSQDCASVVDADAGTNTDAGDAAPAPSPTVCVH
jgi:hypothetical protein